MRLIARASKNRSLMMSRESFSLLYRPLATLLQQSLPQSAARNLHAHRQIAAALHGPRRAARARVDAQAPGGLPQGVPAGRPADGRAGRPRARARGGKCAGARAAEQRRDEVAVRQRPAQPTGDRVRDLRADVRRLRAVSARLSHRVEHARPAAERGDPRHPRPGHGDRRHRPRHRHLDGRGAGGAGGPGAADGARRPFAADGLRCRARAGARLRPGQRLADRLCRGAVAVHHARLGPVPRRARAGGAVPARHRAMEPAARRLCMDRARHVGRRSDAGDRVRRRRAAGVVLPAQDATRAPMSTRSATTRSARAPPASRRGR